MSDNNLSQKSQEKPVGNTNSTGSSMGKYQLYRYFFTIPRRGELIEPEILHNVLKPLCKKFVFQGEKGESGYEHWQGEVSLKHKEYPHTFKNLLGTNEAHVEPTKNMFAANKYCSKSDTRTCGPFNQDYVFIKTINELLPWQKELRDILIVPPEYFSRKIYWYYNKKGGYGKSEFCRYMLVHHKACVFSNAKTSDIAFAIGEDSRIILFDLPRDSESRFNYSVIEQLKNGLIFSSKYESGTKVFEKPHIVIFSNDKPEFEALTEDKWIFIEV